MTTLALVLAAWLKLSFTAPSDPRPTGPPAKCASYQCQRWDAGVNWYPTLLWRDTLMTALCVPANAGAPDSGWVSVPSTEQAWRNGGCALHIRSMDFAGNWSGWSNRLVGVAADRDTVWFLKRYAPMRYVDAKSGRSCWWSLDINDGAYATVAHCEEVNRAERFTICNKLGNTFGHVWALRGQYYPCADSVADLRIDR